MEVSRDGQPYPERERLQEAGLEVVRSGVLGALGLAQRVGVVAAGRGHDGAVGRADDAGGISRMGHDDVRSEADSREGHKQASN